VQSFSVFEFPSPTTGYCHIAIPHNPGNAVSVSADVEESSALVQGLLMCAVAGYVEVWDL